MQLINSTDSVVNVMIQNNNGTEVFKGPLQPAEFRTLPLSSDFTYDITANSGGSPARATNVQADATVTFKIEGGQLVILKD